MSSTTYDWFTVNDNGTRGGDGTVSVGRIPYYRGRVDRSADIVLKTAGNAQAVITVEQTGLGEYIEIEQIEDNNGVMVETLPAEGGIFYIVGHSNSDYLSAAETSTETNTDMNSVSGMLKRGGFTIYENDGAGEKHGTVRINTQITPDYGASDMYLFKMPFTLNENTGSSEIALSFSVSNQSSTLSDSFSIDQEGVS